MAKLECEYKYTYTAKERQFCDNIALKGMTQYDALLRMLTMLPRDGKEIQLMLISSRMMDKPKIRLRVEELRETIQEKSNSKSNYGQLK